MDVHENFFTRRVTLTTNIKPDTTGDFYRVTLRYAGTPEQPVPPATDPILYINPGGVNGNIDVFKLPRVWCNWLRELNTINGDDHPWRFIQIPKAGLFNVTADAEWYAHGTDPTYNAVVFQGNVVKKKRVAGNWMYIETIRIDQLFTPPAISFYTHPWLVHEFTTLNAAGNLGKAGNGFFVQCPLFSNQEVALPLAKLEPWPDAHPPLP